MESHWLDESNNELYKFEKGARSAFQILVPLALLISSTGLIGFIFLYNEEKSFEYSIRRVLGASWKQVLFRVYKKVLPGILIASIIAIIVCSYASNRWLDNFAFRFKPDIFLFILPILSLIILMFLVIAFMVLNKLRQPPILFLHDE